VVNGKGEQGLNGREGSFSRAINDGSKSQLEGPPLGPNATLDSTKARSVAAAAAAVAVAVSRDVISRPSSEQQLAASMSRVANINGRIMPV